MFDLYIVRHGQTVFNAADTKTFTGWMDIDLSEVGVHQAEELGVRLNQISFSRAYSSNLLRARRTLELILSKQNQKPEIIIDNRIIERSYGQLEGQLHNEIKIKHPDMYPIWHRSYDVPPPGGESVKMVEKRVYPFVFELIKNAKDGEKVIISAHGNSIRAMRAYLEDLSVKDEMSIEIPQNDYLHYRVQLDKNHIFGGKIEKIYPVAVKVS